MEYSRQAGPEVADHQKLYRKAARMIESPQMQAFDLIRASSRGKPFWHAEAYGGPLWLAPQVVGKPRDEGRIPSPEDIRYWSLVSFMGGATGMMYLRWRPLLNGPLFGAFGPYAMDGSRTPRSEMVSKVGKWATAPERARLWSSRADRRPGESAARA